MEYAGFTNEAEAFAYRKAHGGWLCAARDGSEFIAFRFGITRSQIMTHRCTRGIREMIVTTKGSLAEAIGEIDL